MNPVECELARLVIDETSQAGQMIALREKGGSRAVPIIIGIVEALAISRKLSDDQFPRPMTHDLFCNALQDLNVNMRRIIVTDLRNDTFYAVLELEKDNGDVVEVDARPSDAIALAVRSGCPVFVAEHVLNHASNKDDAS